MGWYGASLAWRGALHTPAPATWSLSLRNTPTTNTFLATYTKGISPLPGLPWDIPALLQKTQAQSVSIFMQNTTLAIALYRPHEAESLTKEAESFGFKVTNSNHILIISSTPVRVSSNHLTLPPLFGLGSFQRESTTVTIKKKRDALSISLPTESYQPTHLLLPTNDSFLALRILPTEGISQWLSLHEQLSIFAANALETYGGEVAVWEKEGKAYYSLWIPTTLDANTLHVLTHASAQAYAQPTTHERIDGKFYTETRLAKPLTLTSTTTNDVTSTIATTATNDVVMRVTQTATSTTITNAPLEAGQTFTPSARIDLERILNQDTVSSLHTTNSQLLLRTIKLITLQKDRLTIGLQ